MIRIISANLNGIRSAASKGFFEWLGDQQADFVGVQELKAQADQVQGAFDAPHGMNGWFHYAQKKGYSGVGLYSRHIPSDVITGIGVPEFDDEGRWVELRFDTSGRRLSIISCYFPSGSASEDRQASKFRFLEAMAPRLQTLRAERDFVLVGDSGEKDPEIYAEVVRRHPGRVLAVYIRDVTEAGRDSSVLKRREEVRKAGGDRVLGADSPHAANHAVAHGPLTPGALRRGRTAVDRPPRPKQKKSRRNRTPRQPAARHRR